MIHYCSEEAMVLQWMHWCFKFWSGLNINFHKGKCLLWTLDGRLTMPSSRLSYLCCLSYLCLMSVCGAQLLTKEASFTCICHILCGCICPRTRHKGHLTHLLTIWIFMVTSPARVAQGTLP